MAATLTTFIFVITALTYCHCASVNVQHVQTIPKLNEPVELPKFARQVSYLKEDLSSENSYDTASACGGYIEGLSGTIDYKVNETVANREVCIWTIHVPRKEIIQVRLASDGFYSNFQRLRVFNTSSSTRYQFRPALVIEKGDRTTYNVTGGSLIQIVFGTFVSENYGATGFSLVFQGIGPDSDSSDWRVPALKVLQPTTVGNVGRINYTENAYPSRAEGEFVTFTLSPPRGMEVALTLESYGGPNRGEGCAWNDYYWYDTIRISEILWNTDSTIMMQQCEKTYFKNTVLSSYPLVVSLYSFIGERRSFEFSWEFF
jgi:hypothetical protein